MEFPLKGCKMCIHNTVCKHIDMINHIMDQVALPLDWDNVTCLEYTSSMGTTTALVEDICDDAIDRIYNQELLLGVVVSEATFAANLLNSPKYTKYNTISIDEGLNIPVTISNMIPDGQYEFITGEIREEE